MNYFIQTRKLKLIQFELPCPNNIFEKRSIQIWKYIFTGFVKYNVMWKELLMGVWVLLFVLA